MAISRSGFMALILPFGLDGIFNLVGVNVNSQNGIYTYRSCLSVGLKR